MKSARILAFLLACQPFASIAFGQSSATATAGAGAQVMERYVYPRGLPRPVPKGMHTASLGFTVTLLDTNWMDVSDFPQNPTHTFFTLVRNATTSPLPILVTRTQQLPAGWSTSICDPRTCHAAPDSSVPWTIGLDSSASFSLNLTPAIDDLPDSCTVWLRVIGASDTVLLPFYGTYQPANPPIVFEWGGNFTLDQTYQGSGPDTVTMTNYLENHAGRGIDYSLSMQDSLPSGWSLTFCDERNPNSTTGNMDSTCTSTSGSTLTSNFSALYDTSYQQPITFTLDVPPITSEGSAVIFLSVHPHTSNPLDSANYRFVMHVQPQSSVTGAPEDRAGLAVTNAWPNPLVGSGALHLEILTDAAGPATALIYDVTGAQKGRLELGTLHSGSNELQVNAPNLPSGEYIIRVDQGASASEAVRINYVK